MKHRGLDLEVLDLKMASRVEKPYTESKPTLVC